MSNSELKLPIDGQQELANLEIELTEATNRHAESIAKVKLIESELSSLNARVRGANTHRTRLTPEDYRGICNRQAVLKKKIADLTSEAMIFKTKAREINSMISYQRTLCGIPIRGLGARAADMEKNIELRQQIVAVRDQWLQFAEDPTRVNSMRLMASQFGKELTDILAKFGP